MWSYASIVAAENDPKDGSTKLVFRQAKWKTSDELLHFLSYRKCGAIFSTTVYPVYIVF